MARRWRWLIWAVPLGLVTLTFALSWHFDPDFWRSPASLMRLAKAAGQRGDQPRALELARKAVSREPGNADYSLSLAQICLEAGQPQETLDLTRKLHPQEAKTSRCLNLQAQALDRLGDRQAALELLAGGLQDNPEDAELLAVAAALAAQGSYDRPLAITYYQRLYQLTRTPLVRRQLVELLVSLDRFPEAIPLQEEEAAQFPNDSEALHLLALLHYWQRDYQAAGPIYQRLLEKTAGDAALRLEAARNAEAINLPLVTCQY